MSKHRSHLYILTGAFMALVAGVLGSTVFSNGLNVMPLKASTIVGGTITFNATNFKSSTTGTATNHYNNVYEVTTSSGATYELHIDNSYNQTSKGSAGTTIGQLQSINYIVGKLYVTSTYAGTTKTFQKINSISITSISMFDRACKIYYDGDTTGVSFTASKNATTVINTSSINPRCFEVQFPAGSVGSYLNISEVSINYDCDPNYSEDATLSSIELSGNYATNFTVGDTFNYDGLIVTAHYSDLTSQVVTPTSVTSPDMSTSGEKTITVTYTEDEITKSNSYVITVSEASSGYTVSPGDYTTSGCHIILNNNNTGYFYHFYNNTQYNKVSFTYSVEDNIITFIFAQIGLDSGAIGAMNRYKINIDTSNTYIESKSFEVTANNTLYGAVVRRVDLQYQATNLTFTL